MHALLSRTFGLVDDPEPPSLDALRRYEAIVVLVIGVEYWLRAIPKWGQLAPHYYLLLAIATVGAPLALVPITRRPAFATLAASHLALVWTEFPSAGNHAYLELLLCAVAAFVDPRVPAERALALRAVRWMAVLVLGYSGMQKLVHGTYFTGEFLAFSLKHPSYRPILRPFLPASEYDRLIQLTGAVGDGPYAVEGLVFRALANGIWLGEMACAAALFVPRLRAAALAVTCCLLLGIELGAREVFFGMLYTTCLLTFRLASLRVALPVVAIALALLTLSRVGVLPEATFY